MTRKKYISIREFCRGHSLDEEFIFRLREYELVRIVEVEEEPAFPHEQLGRLERLVRLHRDLQINPQGLQAIDHLLERLDSAQEELQALRRRLRRLE